MSTATELLDCIHPANEHKVSTGEEARLVLHGSFEELDQNDVLSEYFGDLTRHLDNLDIDHSIIDEVVEQNAYIHYRRWWRGHKVVITFTFEDDSTLTYHTRAEHPV